MTTSTTRISGASQAQVVYRGHPDGETVTVERSGSQPLRVVERLPHIAKHSPTVMDPDGGVRGKPPRSRPV